MTLRFPLRMFLVCTAFFGLEIFGAMEGARERGFDPEWPRLISLAAIRWYSWMAVAPFVQRAAMRGVSGGRPVGAQLPVAAAFILAHQILVTASTSVLGWDNEPIELRRLPPRLLPDMVLYSGLAWALISIEERKCRAEADARMRAALAEARLDALRQQLTPVSREMASVELYLEIERARFGPKLQVEVSVDAHALDALVPSLLLQPLLENAMRHGISPADGSCRVRLAVRARGDRLLIDVRDEGPGESAGTASTGIGLANTRERLRHLYGHDHRFTFDAAHGTGARVAVDIPLRRAS